MAVTFVAGGALAAQNNSVNLLMTAPACADDDILIAQFINKSVTARVITPPAGWTAVTADEVNDCTTAADDHQFSLYWKRAVAASDSGANFTFAKSSNDGVLFAGVISAWRGCKATGSPLDATAPARTKSAGGVHEVAFPAFDPAVACHVVYMSYYGNDVSTFNAAMSADTNPDCAVRYDLETSVGNDCSLACCSGDSDGSNIASRTWGTTLTADAGNTGVVFGLVPSGAAPNIAAIMANYRRIRNN